MADVAAALSMRAALEEEIAGHAQAIIDLRGRLNTLTTIARLPPELLSEIFLHVVRDSYDTHHSYHYGHYGVSRFYAWIQVSHVCRSWRAVALNTPRLWGHIILTKRPIVEDLLSRSKKAPLLISASISSTLDDRVRLLEDVMRDPSRLQEFHLSGPARLLQDFCPKLARPASNLEALVLADSGAHTYSHNVGDTALSPELFTGQLPRLRSLEIRQLVFSWKNPVLSPSLTRLVLIGRLDSQALLGSFDQLLAALDSMSCLESLDLQDAVPRLPAETLAVPAPQRTVALPRLRSIALTGQCLDCANLINHLSMPPTALLKLTGRSKGGGRELFRIVGEHFAPLLTVRLLSVHGRPLQMSGWRTLIDPSAPFNLSSPDTQPDFELCIDCFTDCSIANDIITASKWLAPVRSVAIESSYHTWRWKDVFAKMPNLRTLSIIGNPQDDLLAALSTVRQGKKKRPPSMPLPHLRVLGFTEARLCSVDYDDPPEFLDKLEDWLLMRCNYNLPIDELRLNSCYNVTMDEVERLAEVVPYVDWDGEEQFESEGEEDEEDEEDEDEGDLDMFYDEDYDHYDYDYDMDDPYGVPWGLW